MCLGKNGMVVAGKFRAKGGEGEKDRQAGRQTGRDRDKLKSTVYFGSICSMISVR